MSRMLWVPAGALFVVLCLAGCQPQVAPPSMTASPKPVAPVTPPLSGLMQKAQAAFAAGDCVKAMPAIEAARSAEPTSAKASLLFGLCAARLGDTVRAEAALRQAASLDKTDPHPLEALGILLYTQQKREPARQTLAEAEARGSTSAQVAYYQGNLAMFAGDCLAALAAYRRSLNFDPDFAPALTEYRAAWPLCARVEDRKASPVEPPHGAQRPAPATASGKKTETAAKAPAAPATGQIATSPDTAQHRVAAVAEPGRAKAGESEASSPSSAAKAP